MIERLYSRRSEEKGEPCVLYERANKCLTSKKILIIDAINNQIMDMNGKIFPLYLLE